MIQASYAIVPDFFNSLLAGKAGIPGFTSLESRRMGPITEPALGANGCVAYDPLGTWRPKGDAKPFKLSELDLAEPLRAPLKC